jgi:hypothetical protein
MSSGGEKSRTAGPPSSGQTTSSVPCAKLRTASKTASQLEQRKSYVGIEEPSRILLHTGAAG